MADANDREDLEQYNDLLPCLKSLIIDYLGKVKGINQSRLGLCSLKFNKKLSSGDLIVPAFVRTCCVEQLNEDEDNFGFQILCQEIINCISRIQFVKHCQLTSGGHLLLTLNKSLVTRTVIYNVVINKVDQFGKSTEKLPLYVLLNPSFLWSSHSDEHDNLSLDQLRTVLVCEHTKELLQANGVSVKPMSFDCQTIQSELIQTRQQICHLFSPLCSSNETHPCADKDIDRRAKELGDILKNCKYTKQVRSVESNETVSSDNQATPFSKHSCVCGDKCCCTNYVLHVDDFLKNGKQVSVTVTCSLLKDLAKLDLAGESESSADMLVHVTSCRRAFTQQQVSTAWQMASECPLSAKQFFVTHGLVTVYNDGEKLQDHVDAMELLRIREKQLKESYILKYGDKVEGHGWETSIRQMAIAAVKLEILSVAPNSEVKINLSESSQEFRQATFVMYNCARLAKLFENFEENVQKGVYPTLPQVKEVDFNLLRDEAEWELTLNFILAFPSVVKEAVPTIDSKSQRVTINTNKMCCFLFTLSHKFSSYYGRVHILGESRLHLFPTMFARLYIMKALQQIFLTCLKLLNVTSLKQM